MSEQSPEIVAAASLSPLSPKPISVQIQSNSVVPMLHDQAATTDTAGLNSADSHQSEPMTGVMMDPNLENHGTSAPVSDTIVVAGDSSDFHDDSDGSIGYGEEDETQENATATADGAADAAPDNDEYAKSFDSPVDPQSSNSEAGSGESQPDVSEEAAPSNSMNEQVTSAPVAPAATAHLEDRPPPPTSSTAAQPAEQPNANGGPTLMPGENEPPSTTTPGPPNSLSAPAPHPTSMLPTPGPNHKSDASVHTAVATAGPPMQDPASIQKLVDDITARASATDTAPTTSLLSGPHPPSLPPKPLVSAPPQSYQSRGPSIHGHPLTPTDGGLMRQYNSSGHSTYRNSYDMEPSALGQGQGSGSGFGGSAWDTFLAEERQYTSEQNWDKFPEGSRVFVGNLSSDRVSKQQVFAIFSKYGRLAQISMKSAYGFVQYHTVSEAQAALEACQDMEIGGRRIQLEISRRQTRKPSSGDNRGHSPERRPGPRGPPNDRFDSNSRRDFRRSASPRRDNSRGFYSRDRDNGPMSHDRRRSRSPPRRGRFGSSSDPYRRRSVSPHHRRTPSELDIPQRYGNDVPDIQILLLHDVDRPFVTWVQDALHARGLKTAVMHLNPRFPRETIVQRQVLEGVHAIIDLDHNSPLQGKVSMQLFIRNTNTNIRFENYSQLDPPIAAELVIREKSKAAVQARPLPIAAQPAYPPTYQPPAAAYQPPPVVPPPPPATGYPHHQQQPHYPPLQQVVPPPIPQAAPPPTVPAAIPDLSKVDNDTLRTILAGLQAQPHQAQHAAAPAPQIDINALLGSLQNAAPQQYGAPPSQAGYYSGVPPPPAVGQNNAGGNNAHIQNIMENLKRASGGK